MQSVRPDTVNFSRGRLLFISPVTPSTTGNGLAMRAGAFVEALAADFEVYVLVVAVNGEGRDNFPGDLAPLCKAVRRLTPTLVQTLFGRVCHHPLFQPLLGRLHSGPAEWKAVSAATLQAGLRIFGSLAFDHIHVFRLYLHPYAERYAALERNRNASVHIDLDELESRTRRNLAQIHSGPGSARRLIREARLYERLEKDILPRYDKVYVCSPGDCNALQQTLGADHVVLLPNTVRLPPRRRLKEAGKPFTYLFVGNLNYFPNRDALQWFAEQVLPALRRHARQAFRVHIVGSGKPRELRRLAQIAECEFKGFLPSVDAAYRGADAVIVPLRAGGGTRIKILESLAAGVPVVSTPIGAAGLQVRDGLELLLAEGAEEFAMACARLMDEGPLRRSLAQQGRQIVEAHYSQDALASRLHEFPMGRQPADFLPGGRSPA